LPCPRGAASPDTHTQRRLFAASAGYCQNPGCERELFVDAEGKSIHVAEMAHVFAAGADGPRGTGGLSKAERGSFDNLVMLCAICHTVVDKAPEAYPDGKILGWKRDHAAKLKALFGVVEFDSREAAREAIEPILSQNRAIFDQYGPHIEAAENPESGAVERWKRKMLTRILPNNNRVLALLDANRKLLRKDERESLELFRQHVDDLQAYHIEGLKSDASRFPAAMTSILET
jgi:hypothetical protein